MRVRVLVFAFVALVLTMVVPTHRAWAGERCGASTCATGEVCCNDSCGICVPPGGACILPHCGWGIDRVANRRPLRPIDAPFAIPGPWVATQAGGGSLTLPVAGEVPAGQAVVAGSMPLGRSFGLRALVGLRGVHIDTTRGALSNQIDRQMRAELGVAWNVPTGVNRLHLSVLIDALLSGARELPDAGGPTRGRVWSSFEMGLAPGVAATYGFAYASVSGYVREVAPLFGAPSARAMDTSLQFGVSAEMDAGMLGLPIGLLVRGSMGRTLAFVGVGAFWLPGDLRVALTGQVAFEPPATTTASWPWLQWNLRFDWLPSPD